MTQGFEQMSLRHIVFTQNRSEGRGLETKEGRLGGVVKGSFVPNKKRPKFSWGCLNPPSNQCCQLWKVKDARFWFFPLPWTNLVFIHSSWIFKSGVLILEVPPNVRERHSRHHLNIILESKNRSWKRSFEFGIICSFFFIKKKKEGVEWHEKISKFGTKQSWLPFFWSE